MQPAPHMPDTATSLARTATWLRTHAGGAAAELVVNVALPWLLYDQLAPAFGDVIALLASSAPPLLWALVEFGRRRKVDALSVLVMAGIVLSLLAVAGGGSAKFLQLRENLVTALIGLAFLASTALRRPLIYQLARAQLMRRSAQDATEFEANRDAPAFRRTMTVLTLVWGFGLVASAALACVLVFTLTISDYLLVSPFVGYGIMGALALWSAWYARRARLDPT